MKAFKVILKKLRHKLNPKMHEWCKQLEEFINSPRFKEALQELLIESSIKGEVSEKRILEILKKYNVPPQ